MEPTTQTIKELTVDEQNAKDEQKRIFKEEQQDIYDNWKIKFEKYCFITENDCQLNFINKDGLFHRMALDIRTIEKKLKSINFMCRILNVEVNLGIKAPCLVVWISDYRKRSFKKIDCIPPPQVCPIDVYNLWSGFKFDKIKLEHSLSDAEFVVYTFNKFMRHVGKSTAGLCEFLTNWIADIVQSPGLKPGIMLILTGLQGTYKGTLYELILKLIQEYAAQVSDSEKVFSKHSTMLVHNLFLNFNEAVSKKMIDNAGKLKALVTDTEVTIEQKYESMLTISNYSRIMVSTNHDVGAKSDLSDRRNLEVETEKMPDDLRNDIWKVIKNEKYMYILFHHLKNNVTVPYKTSHDWQSNRPVTEKHLEIVERFSDPIYQFLLEITESQTADVEFYKSNDLHCRYLICAKFPKNLIVFMQDISKMNGIIKKRVTINKQKFSGVKIDKELLREYLISNKFVTIDEADEEDGDMIVNEEFDDLA